MNEDEARRRAVSGVVVKSIVRQTMPIGAIYRPALSKPRLTSNALGSEGTQAARFVLRNAHASELGRRATAAAAERKGKRMVREVGGGRARNKQETR